MDKKQWKEKRLADQNTELARLKEYRDRVLKTKEEELTRVDEQIAGLEYEKEAIDKLKI